MSLLYSSSFKYPDGDLRKNQDLVDTYHHHQQQNHQNNYGLTRYRSAPSSFFESLNDGSNNFSGANGGINCEDYPYIRPSSPEMESLLAKYVISCNGSGDSGSHDMQEFGGKTMKQEEAESISQPNGYANVSQMMYQSLPVHNLENDSTPADSSFGGVNSLGSQSSVQAKLGTSNGSNLLRQNSSPAGFLSNLGVENGFSVMRDLGSFRACNTTNGEATPSTSRLNGTTSFSSRPSPRFMPQIAEVENENMGATSPENRSLANVNGSTRNYMPNFASDSFQGTSFNVLKRARESDGNMFCNFNTSETQNGDSRNRPTGLTHHLSLPKTPSEMAAIEKFLQFQGSVPCKIRAKRGFATHPRSIAERVRRTRISERMRKLQELFPNLDKQTNTADMLDMAVEHIKDLQKQVKKLTDTKARCTCKEKQFSNFSA